MQLTTEHKQIAETVTRFVKEEINPHVDEWEKAEQFDRRGYAKVWGKTTTKKVSGQTRTESDSLNYLLDISETELESHSIHSLVTGLMYLHYLKHLFHQPYLFVDPSDGQTLKLLVQCIQIGCHQDPQPLRMLNSTLLLC